MEGGSCRGGRSLTTHLTRERAGGRLSYYPSQITKFLAQLFSYTKYFIKRRVLSWCKVYSSVIHHVNIGWRQRFRLQFSFMACNCHACLTNQFIWWLDYDHDHKFIVIIMGTNTIKLSADNSHVFNHFKWVKSINLAIGSFPCLY